MHLRKIQSIHGFQETHSENLLDVIVPVSNADISVHTFSEFKDWMNHYQINTLIKQSTIYKKQIHNSLKLRQTRSMAADAPSPTGIYGSLNLKKARKSSMKFQPNNLEEIKERGENLEISQLSRSRKNSESFLNLGYELTQKSKDDKKSVHSSKSVHGYEQINQYQLRERIGKGSFSEVFLGIDLSSEEHKLYAIKIMESKSLKKKFFSRKNSQIVSLNEGLLEEDQEGQEGNDLGLKESSSAQFVRNEVAILKKLSHQYITRLYEVITDRDKQKIYLVLEFCPKGFINQSEKKGVYRRLLESECKRYFKQLVLAINYIHNIVKIAHRDIKPENILLSDHDEVKLSDFGLSTDQMQSQVQSGTKLFMPPDFTTNQKLNQPADIWAIGVTLLILLTGKNPDFKNEIIDLEKIIESLKEISEECKDFLLRCLEKDEEKRIRAEEMINHSWLNVNEVDLLRGTQNQAYDITITAVEQKNAVSNKINKFDLHNLFQI